MDSKWNFQTVSIGGLYCIVWHMMWCFHFSIESIFFLSILLACLFVWSSMWKNDKVPLCQYTSISMENYPRINAPLHVPLSSLNLEAKVYSTTCRSSMRAQLCVGGLFYTHCIYASENYFRLFNERLVTYTYIIMVGQVIQIC